MRMEPLPLEKELRVESLKRGIAELSRDELVQALGSTLDILARLTHQTKQLLAHIEFLESAE